MAKLGSSAVNYTLNAVAIEDELNSITQNLTQEVINVRGFATTAPEKVIDGYDYSYSLGGSWDGAASQGDATIHGLIGSAAVASGFDPTGNTAAASDPNYDSSVFLSSYTISASTGAAVTYSATLEGTGALTRAVA